MAIPSSVIQPHEAYIDPLSPDKVSLGDASHHLCSIIVIVVCMFTSGCTTVCVVLFLAL
eukprot:m.271437 g.271437  ORF g.271437 m.271437 type:complete len:59 (+) comp15683_c1_seq16:4293-4469(+)